MYQVTYKCQLCGKEFEKYKTGEEIANLLNIPLKIVEHTAYVKCRSNLIHPINHYCEDVIFGFADFQGFKKAEE